MDVASAGTGREMARLVQSVVAFSASPMPFSSISIAVPLSILSHRDAPTDTPAVCSSPDSLIRLRRTASAGMVEDVLPARRPGAGRAM